MPGPRGATLLLLYILSYSCLAQDQPGSAQNVINLPSKFLQRIQHRTSNLEDNLNRKTERYLEKMARNEERLRRKLYKADSNAAKSLFDGSAEHYATLSRNLRHDTGSIAGTFSGEYYAYTDSLQGILKFLQQSGNASPQLQSSLRHIYSLQAKMADADQVNEYVRQRKQQISQYIQQHTSLSKLLGKDFKSLNQEVYYYSQQVREYREMLNDPDKLMKQALAMLNKLPAFQAFMQQNSQLTGLFNLPGNYGSSASLAGLQTRDQVASIINQQVAAAGSGGQAALQANLQSAQSQLQGYKNKLNKLGNGSGDIEMPDFKPNGQKTKAFWKRLEYGTNLQTTRNNYFFPTVSDFGISIGYKLNDRGTIGIGGSYKLGWGNGIQHISLSSQGAGLRSFVDIKIKGTFSASGGLEYNYTTPFRSMQQLHDWNNWTKSGLIGITKTISLKSPVFRKTKVQLLWDFLSYQQVPRTQPVIFRIGYMWQ